MPQETKKPFNAKEFLESIPEYNQIQDAVKQKSLKRKQLFNRKMFSGGSIILTRIADVLCFVVGPCVFSVGFFSGFSFNIKNKSELIALRFGKIFYPNGSEIILMTIGVALICLGFLIRHWRRNNKINSH